MQIEAIVSDILVGEMLRIKQGRQFGFVIIFDF